MRVLPLLALALSLAACASDADAPAPTPDVATVAEMPAVVSEPDSDAVVVDEIDPADASVAADAPADDPIPAAGPPEDRPAAPVYAEGGLSVLNDTGMVLITLHVAGCNESEGEDWAAMETWATDYLGDEVLMAGDTAELDLVPGCYVMRSQWEDGTVAQERVEATQGMTHVLMLG